MELIERYGIYVHPGYYFDFTAECFLVVSLLKEPTTFEVAIQKIIDCVG